jgi:Xaa-Pro aminopeptidase
MSKANITAMVITGTDPHQSEYLADHWNDRYWLSSFTGSAGSVVVTQDFAGLWTDSRYFLQGEKELKGTGIALMKQKVQFHPEHILWLADNLSSGSTIAINGFTLSVKQLDSYYKLLPKSFIIDTKIDLISSIWDNRTAFSGQKIMILDERYAGKSSLHKISDIIEHHKKHELDYSVYTSLDDIAWILNMRGSDVTYNPLFMGYLIVGNSKSALFTHSDKIDNSIISYLKSLNIALFEYQEIGTFLADIDPNSRVGFDMNVASVTIYNFCSASKVPFINPVTLPKAIKNEVEIANTEQAMISDGVALAQTFYWLEKVLEKEDSTNEYEVAKMLAFNRSKHSDYVSESFAAIVGYKGNGAIIHYHPTAENHAIIKKAGVLLVDSGGQYLTGTTDITRTLTLSPPTDEVKTNFTLVLKGMIALTKAVFPKGTLGVQLEILARQYLWKHNLNYSHGTGHGVGYFLNVHEGPQGFSGLNSSRGKTAFVPGMITSNEPGHYKENEYGIRIENLLLCIEDEHPDFLRFKTLTYYPIDIVMMDDTMLDKGEKAWLNAYHNEVYEKVSPFLDESIRPWFKVKCNPLN